MSITTNTKIFGSFSSMPGNNGAKFFNEKFKEDQIDAIYLPVKCDDTNVVFDIIKNLNFSGAALSQPHKISALKFLDYIDDDANTIGSVNTVKSWNNKLYGYNTDWIGVYETLKELNLKKIHIFGTGGFSLAVQHATKKLHMDYTVIGRNDRLPEDDWPVFNSTPVEIDRPHVIDGRPFTDVGLSIFRHQATAQYTIYMSNL